MPEGHTIHRLAAAFTGLFAERTVEASSPQGRFTAGATLLSGQQVMRAEAWGKHLFIAFSDESALSLHVHLGLYGSWTFAGDGTLEVTEVIGAPRRRISEREAALPALAFPPEPRGQVRLRLLSDHAVADLTGPTICAVRDQDEVRSVVARLGPDPLRSDAAPQRFFDALAKRRTPVAAALMDQSVIAGIGNIYRAEALFRAGLDPMKPCRDVPAVQAAELWADVCALMADGVRTGKIVTTTPLPGVAAELPGDREIGDFFVYQRTGQPCIVCGHQIQLRELAGRKLYWCPSCQA